MKKKVLAGLSGGVDSSVAAALLTQRGYDVVGVTLKLYDYEELDFDPPDGGCCTIDLINDARAACAKLGVPHYVLDLRDSFRKHVIDDFIESYSRGRTPNPCVNCNTHIKWGEMLKLAGKLECDWIATGHYARVDRTSPTVRLLRGIDEDRDQSYALWGIPGRALSRTLFPLGEMRKTETRAMARQLGLCNADRPDSQEICFVPANDYSYIIRLELGDEDQSLRGGPIIDSEGRKLGSHKGIANFTIGQRRGLGISRGVPLYVTGIDPEQRSIIVGTKDRLMATRFSAIALNFFVTADQIPDRVEAKIRYRHQPSAARLILGGDRAEVEFEIPQRAITPGQSVVFYEGEQVLGGGIIDKVSR